MHSEQDLEPHLEAGAVRLRVLVLTHSDLLRQGGGGGAVRRSAAHLITEVSPRKAAGRHMDCKETSEDDEAAGVEKQRDGRHQQQHLKA
jgi:hypothetical protein